MMRVSAIVVFLVAAVLGEKKRYDDYKLYSLFPATTEESQLILNLSHEFDIWKYARALNQSSDVLVPPEKRQDFETFLKDSKILYEIKIQNVQNLINEEEIQLRSRSSGMEWTDYHTLEEIYQWMDELFANYSNVKLMVIGQSYEGRPIKGIEINFGSKLQGVFIESGIHAREWIGPASTTWMVNEILKSPTDSAFRKFNYFFFPVINPDGYAYSWTTDRFWRKTRTPYQSVGVTCYGADANRNWDFKWSSEGLFGNPCNEKYSGPHPFSEIEMKSLADYINSIVRPRNVDIYLSYHSYSEMLLYRWSYTYEPAPLAEWWEKIGQKAAKAVEAVNNTHLYVGSSSSLLYLGSGTSVDWFYGVHNVSISFTIEMRDKGYYGYLLPRDQIIPNSKEFFRGMESLLEDYLLMKKEKL